MSPLNRLGQAAARHARLVILIWLVATVGAVALAGEFGGTFNDRYVLPGAHSQQATDLLEEKFPQVAGTRVTVVFRAPDGTFRDPGAAAAMTATLGAIARQPDVIGVTDPLTTPGAVSVDATIAYAAVQYDKEAGQLAQPAVDRLQAAAGSGRAAGLQVEFGGELLDYASPLAGSAGEGVGLLVAAVILLIAFGSVMAAGLPILTAIVALTSGISLVVLLAAKVEVSTAAPTVAAMLGLGAGIDYALFISNRFREQLRSGHSVVESVGIALATAGRAVLFAGLTVVISILGLWLADFPFLTWMATSAVFAVAVTILAAMTLLPALLGLLGHRIERWHIPQFGRTASAATSDRSGTRGWAGWTSRVVARPWPYLLASLGILLVLAAPILDLRSGMPDQGSASPATTQRKAYDLLAQGFGAGINGPILLVVDLPPGDTRVLESIVSKVGSDPDVAAVAPAQVNAAVDTAMIAVVPKAAPQSATTVKLLDRLTVQVLPAATSGTGAQVHVGGVNALYVDVDGRSASRLPLVVGGVIAVSFLLLLLAFRSIAVAFTAAVLNILSLGAAFGVLVAVFQWGWGVKLVGLDEALPIASIVPLFVFAILFGLSMDYEVFLLSRIREAYTAGADTGAAIVSGVGLTARVITSAALVMVAVFLSFVPVDMVSIKMIGVGLATAILVDATIVRVILLPATMAILGRANWWIPGWLDRRLPHLALERADTVAEG
ncbi:MAG: MMPL family transporter [Chloroflexi bacterium]|nr:MMPL family transporter [Chloroflexota bacterium]